MVFRNCGWCGYLYPEPAGQCVCPYCGFRNRDQKPKPLKTEKEAPAKTEQMKKPGIRCA